MQSVQAPTLLRMLLLNSASKRRFHASKITAHAKAQSWNCFIRGNPLSC